MRTCGQRAMADRAEGVERDDGRKRSGTGLATATRNGEIATANGGHGEVWGVERHPAA